MQRRRILFLTLLTSLLYLCTILRAGWLPSRQEITRLNGAAEVSAPGKSLDPFSSPSALRWRQGLPSHWRACLLQR
jgi:hypothetical protein